MSDSSTIDIEYYAVLREQAGLNSETIRTSALTPLDLYRECAERHHFKLLPSQLKVGINHRVESWDTPLNHGDTVAFIPPVAGG